MLFIFRRSFLALLALSSAEIAEGQTFRALFLGNSYTNANNLPQLIAGLAQGSGDTLLWDWNTPGGYTLQGHSTDPTTLQKIKEQKWDFVVLQEQSQLPSFPPSQVQSQVYPYAQILDSLIRDSWSCTEPLFFMTWGRKYGDQANCQFYPPLCTFLGMNTRLRESYTEMAQMNSSSVAPVGMAWQYSWFADSTINLWASDYSHPSLEGSYLSACVFFSVMYRESPIGNSYLAGIQPSVAMFLQQIAHSTVFDSLQLWLDHGDIPYASFSHSVVQNDVAFNDLSLNPLSWTWDFGDGNGSNVANPMHNYSQNGAYAVSLTVQSSCKSHKTTDTVLVASNVGLDVVKEPRIQIYPNPASARISISGIKEGCTVKVFNSGATLVLEASATSSLDLSGLAPGTYLLEISSSGLLELRQLLVILRD